MSFSASKSNTDISPNCDANKTQSLSLEDLLHQSVKKVEKAEQINTPLKRKVMTLMSGKGRKPLHNTQSGKDSCFKPSGNRINTENEW